MPNKVVSSDIDTLLLKQTKEEAAAFLGLEDVAAVWGQVTGTLSNQTDLQNALDANASGVATNASSITTNATGIATNATAITTETDRALAAEALLAPIDDATFTGTTTIPSADITTANFNAGAIDGGEVSWNGQEKTLNLVTGADTTIQVGQETVMYCRNKTGADILNGQVVKIVGAQGNTPNIELAIASTAEEAHQTVGVATQTILGNNGAGFITLVGKVRGLDLRQLNGFTEGGLVYLSATTAGALTPVKPEIEVEIGHALRLGENNGTLGVFINNEASVYELKQELLQQVPHNSDSVIICNDGDDIQEKYDEAVALASGGLYGYADLIVMSGSYSGITGTGNNNVSIIGVGNRDHIEISGITLDQNYGLITNVKSSISITSNYADIKGVNSSGLLDVFENYGTIEGIKTTSGFEITENLISGIIKDVYATGSITIIDNYGTVDNVNSTSSFYNFLNPAIIKNCSASSFLTYYMLNEGTIDNCHSTSTASYAFGGAYGSENYGTIKNCTAAGEFSFGQQYEDSVTENCVGVKKAFAASSNQIYFDVDGFGVSGTYRNCTGGDKSFFGANETTEGGIKTVDANFYNCTAGANSFGFVNFGGAETHFSGKAIGCTSGNNGFFRAVTGFTKILDGAVIENCVGGFNSFANGDNASNEGVILRCRTGVSSGDPFSVTGTGKVRLCLDKDYNEVNLG